MNAYLYILMENQMNNAVISPKQEILKLKPKENIDRILLLTFSNPLLPQ